jgi:serine/threonine-protein kinase
MGLATGNVLDRYVIEGLLGAGSMGRVYRATDTRLRRAVALKVLEVDGIETEVALREARAAAAIVHPNVTAIFDADHSGGTSFIVMELVPGTPLRRYVGDEAVPLATRVRWLIEIAAALAAAHQAGVVHRDIKPENVIVNDEGTVKVLDFGIARFAATATPALGILGLDAPGQTGLTGTPAYMAPEQIQGAGVDKRADQFAWGVVGYELLTGKLPWTSLAGPFGVLAAIVSEVPAPLPDSVPAEVAAVILRALQKSRDARFPSMVEAATPLAPFASGALPILGPAPDSRTRTRAPPPAPRPPPPLPSDPPPSQARVAPLAYSVGPPPGDLGTAPPPSLRTLAAGIRPAQPPPLRDPDFLAPVDVSAHLELLPGDAACKGLFFADLIRLGVRSRTVEELHAQAGLTPRRYVAFRDYPMADNLRLTVAVAHAAYPGLPLGQALRRLGQSAFDAVLDSHIGRTILGVLGRNVEALVLASPKIYRLLLNFGEVSVEKRTDGILVMRARRFPAFLETYQVGLIEGALRHCGAQGRFRIALESLAEATIELDLM